MLACMPLMVLQYLILNDHIHSLPVVFTSIEWHVFVIFGVLAGSLTNEVSVELRCFC